MAYIGNNPNDLRLLTSSEYTTNSLTILANTKCVNDAVEHLLELISQMQTKIQNLENK